MMFKDLWNRLKAVFKKSETSEEEPVMELVTEAAPEPVPERKTSDEMIIEMAEGAARSADEGPDRQVQVPETEEEAAYENKKDTEDEEDFDYREEIEYGEGIEYGEDFEDEGDPEHQDDTRDIQ